MAEYSLAFPTFFGDRLPVKFLESPDHHHLSAASGWLELGNWREANDELEFIQAENRAHPAVLNLRFQIYAAAGKWETCVEIADALVQKAPDFPSCWILRSSALHALGRTQEASELLVPVAGRFPDEWLIRYHLARYAVELGNRKAARKWLEAAFEVGDPKQVKLLALEDPVFDRLWVEIRKI